MKKLKKKGVMNELGGLVTALVFVGILLAVVLLIVAEVRDQSIAVGGAESYAHNGTTEVIGAINDIPSWLPIVVITVIGAVLLGLIQMFRGRR